MVQEKSPRNTRVSVGVWLLEEEEKAWVLWKSLGPQELDVGRGPTTGRMAIISGEQEIHAGSKGHEDRQELWE